MEACVLVQLYCVFNGGLVQLKHSQSLRSFKLQLYPAPLRRNFWMYCIDPASQTIMETLNRVSVWKRLTEYPYGSAKPSIHLALNNKLQN